MLTTCVLRIEFSAAESMDPSVWWISLFGKHFKDIYLGTITNLYCIGHHFLSEAKTSAVEELWNQTHKQKTNPGQTDKLPGPVCWMHLPCKAGMQLLCISPESIWKMFPWFKTFAFLWDFSIVGEAFVAHTKCMNYLQSASDARLTHSGCWEFFPHPSLSPSLVALEMDSEEDDDDDILMKKPLPQPQPELKNSADDRIMFRPAPELTCTRSHSASSACNPTPAKVPHLFSLFPTVRQTTLLRKTAYAG